jgi:hypothetical protein
MVSSANLKEKGFSYHFIHDNNATKYTGKCVEMFNNMWFIKKIKGLHPSIDKNLSEGLNMVSSSMINMVKKGKNAFYMAQSNMCIAPKLKPSLILHEIGHAINANINPILNKFICSARVLPKSTVTNNSVNSTFA